MDIRPAGNRTPDGSAGTEPTACYLRAELESGPSQIIADLAAVGHMQHAVAKPQRKRPGNSSSPRRIARYCLIAITAGFLEAAAFDYDDGNEADDPVKFKRGLDERDN
ncbi:MAG TPA: hypothetical protein VKI44_29305 [Acetobacteraceae bacterium]|nr:hypothetical protein [Acetobacteraceae bacterium]